MVYCLIPPVYGNPEILKTSAFIQNNRIAGFNAHSHLILVEKSYIFYISLYFLSLLYFS